MLFVVVACLRDDELQPVIDGAFVASQMQPSVIVDSQKPKYATKALVDQTTAESFTANFLRIDKDYYKEWGSAKSDGAINWARAYIIEAQSVSSPDGSGLRSVTLNPVQNYTKSGDEYNTSLMVSWHPQTCVLHKNADGTTATITEFEAFQKNTNADVYAVSDAGGVFSVNFSGLNGETDVMVSNAVEAQQWHAGSGDDYRWPFGHSSQTNMKYKNTIQYKHYLSAIRVHVFAENSEQSADMWGKIHGAVVKCQPSECSIALPSSQPERYNDQSEQVGLYASDPGEAIFSGSVDFPLVETPMFGETDGRYSVVEKSPNLTGRTSIADAAYMGYAMIKPDTKVCMDFITDAGIYSVEVDLTKIKDQNDNVINASFEAGYIYDLYLNFQTIGSISAMLLDDGMSKYFDLTKNKSLDYSGVDVEQLSTANCYIIHPGIKNTEGKYYDGYAFNATVAGNGSGGVLSGFDRTDAKLTPVTASLLWETSKGLISQVELVYDYVRFRTPNPDSDKYKEGNAVIAVYDNKLNIIWSWHIWITDNPGSVTLTSGGTTVEFMDRNLGATAATLDDSSSPAYGETLETYGLYYQWGRKDPSMGPPTADFLPQSTTTSSYYDQYGYDLTSADVYYPVQPTIADGVSHPMYLILPVDLSPFYQYDWLYDQKDNLWGYEYRTGNVQKTIYDPCPAGYRVPVEELNWLMGQTRDLNDSRGVKFDNGNLFFPYAGYKGVDRGMSSMTSAWKYVGSKGDYMSAKVLTSGHRARAYMSSASTWSEVGTEGLQSFSYTGNLVSDGANRRVAGSVRCVKEAALGTVRAEITSPKNVYLKDETITLHLSASTPSSTDPKFHLKSAKLEYSVDGGATWNQSQIAINPQDIEGKNFWVATKEVQVPSYVSNGQTVAYRLTIDNGFGLQVQKIFTIVYYPVELSISIGGVDLLDPSIAPSFNWYTQYDITVGLTNSSVMTDVAKINIEGVDNQIADQIQVKYFLDNNFTIQFKDANGNVLFNKAYSLNYHSLILAGETHYEAKGNTNQNGTSSSGLEDGMCIVIANKDDVSRRLYIDTNGSSSLRQDEYSVYNVFQLEGFTTNTSYSSYTNVGKAKLKHLATGKYLSYSNSQIVLVENALNAYFFYFCSDWNTDSEAADNVDIIVNSGSNSNYYYMDAPYYSYVRLSTGGRDHYKWYIYKVANGPDSNN